MLAGIVMLALLAACGADGEPEPVGDGAPEAGEPRIAVVGGV
jgi:hypothetical protein